MFLQSFSFFLVILSVWMYFLLIFFVESNILYYFCGVITNKHRLWVLKQ